MAVFGVECIQLGVGSGQENLLVAGGAGHGGGRGSRLRCRAFAGGSGNGGGRVTGKIGNATAGLVLALQIGAHFGVELPHGFAAVGIQCQQPVVRGAQIQQIADFQRRGLIGEFADVFGAFGVAGLHYPRLLQLGHVGGGDLLQR